MFGRFDVDETAETVPYTKRVIREPFVPIRARRSGGHRRTLIQIAAFIYFAFAAWTALAYLIRELG
jgi:hypothetical protein